MGLLYLIYIKFMARQPSWALASYVTICDYTLLDIPYPVSPGRVIGQSQ